MFEAEQVQKGLTTMDTEIELLSDDLGARELHRRLAEALSPNPEGLNLELRQEEQEFRHGIADPVLVAIVAGTSASISALIAGIFKVFARRPDRTPKIVLRSADGTTVVVPADTPESRLKELIALAKDLHQIIVKR